MNRIGVGLRLPPAIAVAVLFAGCAAPPPMEQTLAPGRLPMLRALGPDEPQSRIMQALDAAPEQAIRAAKFVLWQQSLVADASRLADGGWQLVYVTRTSFVTNKAKAPVEMPFRLSVRVRPEGAEIVIAPHWEAITDDTYRGRAGERFADLREAMLAEAAWTVDRIARQASAYRAQVVASKGTAR